MKKILSLALLASLCACSSAPVIQSSLNGMHYTSAPTNAQDPRLGHPQFYRDDGDGGWWTHAATPGAR